MTAQRSLDVYLQRLRRTLRSRRFVTARVIDETREHLLDAIEAGVQRGLSVDAAEREALERFGDVSQIGGEFQQMYRWDYTAWYLAKVAISVLASITVALAVQMLINVRVALQSEALRLAPGFSRAAVVSVALVVGLAAAWEIGRKPFDRRRAGVSVVAYALVCLAVQWLFAMGWQAFGPATLLVAVGYACARFDQRPARLAALFATFAAVMYAGHLGVDGVFGAGRALAASAALLAVWTSTITILGRFDHAILDTFNPIERG